MTGPSIKFRFCCLWCFSILLSTFPSVLSGQKPQIDSYDVVIYGATAAGVIAAVQVKQMGKTVILVEPGKHVGGLTSGGLGATDIGNKKAIGGLAREFYRRIKRTYENQANWVHERSDDFNRGGHGTSDDTMWVFEPHVAERLFRDLIDQHDITVVFDQRLDRQHGVKKTGNQIQQIAMESGAIFQGKRFIDATYEGDLMAAAGVSFTVGRESNSKYEETLNGIQTKHAVKHQLQPGVDPYRIPGDPESGVLFGIESGLPAADGTGDDRVQTYNLRICATDVAANQIPFSQPSDYDPAMYELLFRNFEAGEVRVPWSKLMMPNRKTDSNNNFGVSTDFIGQSYTWAEATYAERERLYERHVQYTQGLMWTLANHDRVPAPIRHEMSRWGLCKDEFVDTDGWSHQLYVREARRMVSRTVMTQHHCQGRRVVEDGVGLAAYTMDSHNVMRYIDQTGNVRNEGDVQVGGFPPYPVSYSSIIPLENECGNLLVPICLSASHIAYGSIRMEPVFMVLGQSAATAACLSIDDEVDVQRLDYSRLQERLIRDSQILDWTPVPHRNSIKIPESVVLIDDHDTERTGNWTPSQALPPFVGKQYLHDGDGRDGSCSITFSMSPRATGEYEIRMVYSPSNNRATNVPVNVIVGSDSLTVSVNQQKPPPIDGHSIRLYRGTIAAGDRIKVRISNDGTDGHVVADAIYLIKD